MRNAIWLCAIAVIVVSCKRPLDGLEKLHAVAASLETHDLTNAKRLVADRPDIPPAEILMVDDPAFCKEDNMRHSLDRAAHDASEDLVKYAEADSASRYVAAEKALGLMLSAQDDSMRIFCTMSDLATYRSVREPYSREAESILARLREGVHGGSGDDFEAAIKLARVDRAQQDRESLKATCDAKRKQASSPLAKDPLQGRADSYFTQLCESHGF